MSGNSTEPNRYGSARLHDRDERPRGAMAAESGDAPASSVPAAGYAGDQPPPIYVRSTDFARLEHLARLHGRADDPAVRFLLAELDRAIVVRSDWLGSGIVRMHSRVIYRLNGQGEPESRILVYPHQFHPTGQYVSVFSSIGAALLGLREGTAISFGVDESDRQEVLVEKVAYSPVHSGIE